MKSSKNYDREFKENVVKECEETSNLTEVSRRHSIPLTTLRSWVLKKNNKKSPKIGKQEVERLQKELDRKSIEIEMLKELLKKTNRVWLKD